MENQNSKLRHARKELDHKDLAIFSGGRLWPFFDMQKIMAQVYYSEDILFQKFLIIE